MDFSLYYYNATVISIYDGDTITVDIDLGLNTWVHGEKIRLARINTPEIRGEERPDGLVARDFLRQHIEGKPVILQTAKDKKGKYGRYIADVWFQDDESRWINANDLLVDSGLAAYVDY